MPTYKLTYFNCMAKAEIIRLVFAASDVKYEDYRFPPEDWPGDLKAATPFGQVPTLEVDGVVLCQSYTIARFLARRFHLDGKTELEKAQVEMIVDCFEDATVPIVNYLHESDETRKGEIKRKYMEEQLPQFLKSLEAILVSNNGGDKFFVGSELTLADIALIAFVSWKPIPGVKEAVAMFPKLSALQKKVEEIPNVAAWLAKRPDTPI